MTASSTKLERMLAQLTSPKIESIDLVLAGLSENDAELLRRCAIPHDFSVPILKILDRDLTDEKASVALGRLSRLSCVVSTSDGYAVHSSARATLLARWRAPEHLLDFRVISGRLADYYALRLRDVEMAEQQTLWNRYVYHMLASDEEEACKFIEIAFEAYRRQLNLNSAESLLRLTEQYFSILSPSRRALFKYLEGKLASDRGDYKRAADIFQATIRDREAPEVIKARAWNRLGLVHDARREWRPAQDAFLKAIEAFQRAGVTGELSRVLHNLGVVYRDTGNLDKAFRLFSESVDAATKDGDTDDLAAALNALGTVYQRRGELSSAAEALKKAKAKVEQRPYDRARVLNNLGIVYFEWNKPQEGERYFRDSLAVKSEAGDNSGQAYTYMNLVRLYRAGKRTAEAIDAAERAATLFEHGFDWFNAGSAYMNLARLYAPTDLAKATEARDKAVESYQRVGAAAAARDVRKEFSMLLERKRLFPPWFWLVTIVLMIGFAVLGVIVFLMLASIRAFGGV
jgi:tetratricopeptide (TPR) repeat protein